MKSRERFWDGFDPAFAASVHSSILDTALASMSWVDRQYVKAVSLAVDANILTYDPRDHFDNGYIDEGWSRIQARLRTGSLNDFALACHAIADFYAHSTWGVFGARVRGKLQPYNAAAPRFDRVPDYSEDGTLPFTNKARFSNNDRVWKGTRAEAAESCAPKQTTRSAPGCPITTSSLSTGPSATPNIRSIKPTRSTPQRSKNAFRRPARTSRKLTKVGWLITRHNEKLPSKAARRSLHAGGGAGWSRVFGTG